jgi:dolichol kinase
VVLPLKLIRRIQWPLIGLLNAVAVLNYIEAIPPVYNIIIVGGFELLMRFLFSDLIAFSQRKKRNHPLAWWGISIFSPLLTLVYLFFFQLDDTMPANKDTQHKYDFCFISICLISWAVQILVGLWK